MLRCVLVSSAQPRLLQASIPLFGVPSCAQVAALLSLPVAQRMFVWVLQLPLACVAPALLPPPPHREKVMEVTAMSTDDALDQIENVRGACAVLETAFELGAVPADLAVSMPALLSMLLLTHVPCSGNVAQPRLLIVLASTHLCLISLSAGWP